MDYIKGKYVRSIFSSNTGYVIGIMKVLETNIDDAYDFIDRTLTFTGYFPELKEDENYLFHGEMIDHPRYGIQFQVSDSNLIMPEDIDGLVVFLSSDLFKGIGEKQAKKIVDTLGINTIDRILKEPSCLDLVPKLNNKKKEEIIKTLNEYSSSHRIIVSLTEFGFSMKDALLIYNFYKDLSLDIINDNIYQIIDDINDITFNKIDKIYLNQNKDIYFKERIKSSIFYSLNNLLFENGDTYLNIEELKSETEKILKTNIDNEEFLLYLDELIKEDKIVINENRIYSNNLYKAEEYIADKIKYLINTPKTKINNIDELINDLEIKLDINYNHKQKEAIKSSLENNVTIITGGPGTGKTTIIKSIVQIYSDVCCKEKNKYEEIALLAPTGRASKRMMEKTTFPSSTIHRFLKWDKESNSFMVNSDNKNFSKLIIVDEASMLDTEILSSLLEGLTSNIKLVLVGDVNQLPSVGPGNVLKDLIDSGIIKTIYLEELYRQSLHSFIPVLAEEIKTNNLSDNFYEKKDDFVFLECNKDNIYNSISNIAKQISKTNYLDSSIFLAPMYGGVNGIDNLNKCLQEVYNPISEDKKEIKVGDAIYRESDKILQLVNNPDENVFNGDVGIIEKIITEDESDSKKNEMYINFDGNVVRYLPKDFVNIKHGFIISVHKSQGSEFDLVVIPVCKSYYRMLYQKLIYTAITRAKKKLIIVGEKDSFIYAVNNKEERVRKTSLMEKLV